MNQGFGSITFCLGDPDPPENILKFKMLKREICHNASNNRIP